jgi:Cu/Ag efflux pump CusA
VRFTDISFSDRCWPWSSAPCCLYRWASHPWARSQLREFPELERSVIYVNTVYPGANARTIQGFVTTPLQVNIAGARGVEYITSTSNPGVSSIEVHVRLGENTSDVLTEVIAKVNEARDELPDDVRDPVMSTGVGGDAMMYLAFTSDQMTPYQITDYLLRSVQPELATIDGVGKAGDLRPLPGHAHLAGPGAHGRPGSHGQRYQYRRSAATT